MSFSDDEDPVFLDVMREIDFGPQVNYLHDVDFDDLFFDDPDLDPDDFFSDDDFFGGDDFDDDDEFFCDDSHNRIFVSLADSDLLKRLRFYKTRLPRVDLSEPETYESLFQVLEDLELLLKTWRKRTQHPFTAHISRDGKGLNDDGKGAEEEEADVGKLTFGEDFVVDESEASEDESDEASPGQPVHPMLGAMSLPSPPSNSRTAPESSIEVNHSLTKKKYCQSVRLFYKIFVSDESFEQVLRSVLRARKYVHSVIFNLFLAALPDDVVDQLPSEIWEKVWKHTQGRSPDESFLAGYKATTTDDLRLEKDRIMDLFGSAGNLHMFIFETLFKDPHITVAPPLAELTWCEIEATAGNNAVIPYVKCVFDGYFKGFEKHFSRLQVVEGPEESATSLVEKITRGYFTVTHEAIPREDINRRRTDKNTDISTIIVSQTCNDVVAILDDGRKTKECTMQAIIYNTKSNKVVATIHTGVKYLDITGGPVPSTCLFQLTADRLAYTVTLAPAASEDPDSCSNPLFSIKYWRFDPNGDPVANLNEKDFENEFNADLKKRLNSRGPLPCYGLFVTFRASRLRGKDIFVVCQHLGGRHPQTWLFLVDADTGQLIHRDDGRRCILHFADQQLFLEASKGSRVMLSDSRGHEFLFCDVGTKNPRVIATYNSEDLCKDVSHTPSVCHCVYNVLFDQAADRNEFLLTSRKLSSYQLFTYEETDDDQPEVIASGAASAFDPEKRWFSSSAALFDGVFTSVYRVEEHLRFPTGHTMSHFGDLTTLNQKLLVLAIDLTTGSFHELTKCVIRKHSNSGRFEDQNQFEDNHAFSLMNGTSRHLFLGNLSWTSLYFPTPDTLISLNRLSLLRVQFHSTLTATDNEDRRLLKLNLRNVGEGLHLTESGTLKGRLIKWVSTYGFIKVIAPPEAAQSLPNVFVHISDIVNPLVRAVGHNVEFSLGRYQAKLKAVNVRFVER